MDCVHLSDRTRAGGVAIRPRTCDAGRSDSSTQARTNIIRLGPLAKDLNPPPLNLVAHVPLHGDGQIFQFISGGVPGTAMPVWAGTLSDTQMWHLVNYLRTLAEPAALQ